MAALLALLASYHLTGHGLPCPFRALVVILTLVIPFAFLASPWLCCWLWRYQYAHTHVDHSFAE